MSYVCRLINASQQHPVSGANNSPDIGIYFLLKVYVQNSLHTLYAINLHVGVLGEHFTRSTSMYEMIHPKSPYHRRSFTYILFRLDHVWSWWKRWMFLLLETWKRLKFIIFYTFDVSWWCYQMETFSALLAIWAGNSPVPGEFPAQRPVTRSFDVFLDLRLNKWLSKQSWGWWFEMLSHQLWRHRNVVRIRQWRSGWRQNKVKYQLLNIVGDYITFFLY